MKAMIEELLLWANSLGTRLHPDIQIYDDPVTGLSFQALKDVRPDTKLVNCSFEVTLSYLNAVEATGFPRHTHVPFPQEFLETLGPEDPNIIGHFFLMQQYLLRERSFWWHYIRLLPQPDKPSSIPALWPVEDQRYLDGTNAEPAIKKRTCLWKAEWEKGIKLLQDGSGNWEAYTYNLYKWAAGIFGSRSFRPSLTIPEILVQGHEERIRKDKFSILLPVMDIGNHNGINNVNWTLDPISGSFTLSNRGLIRQNDQIFNYYGNKSNSELLVGYGFILPTTPDVDRDVVNLKLKPPRGSLELRRSQSCHVVPGEPEEECMFVVQRRIDREATDRRVDIFMPFSDGLVDLVVCMVANRREKIYISRNPNYCPEKDPYVFKSSLARAILMTLQILKEKLESEHRRTASSVANRDEPQNANQALASDYTKRQISTLYTVNAALTNTFRTFLPAAEGCLDHNNAQVYDRAELLSLEIAFDWLRVNYAEVFTSVVAMISEDQEEPLPLNWTILAEDWDHTYWTVWIFLVWMLWSREGEVFRLRHPALSYWLVDMNSSYDNEMNISGSEILHADESEKPTIDLMVQGITGHKQFSILYKWLEYRQKDRVTGGVARLRNFASYVAREETFLADCPSEVIDSNNSISKASEQKVLCITKGKLLQHQEPAGRWTEYMNRSPGSRRIHRFRDVEQV